MIVFVQVPPHPRLHRRGRTESFFGTAWRGDTQERETKLALLALPEKEIRRLRAMGAWRVTLTARTRHRLKEPGINELLYRYAVGVASFLGVLPEDSSRIRFEFEWSKRDAIEHPGVDISFRGME